jgi:hypothetical protein
MSIVLRTCVARALMDMLPFLRAHAMPDSALADFCGNLARWAPRRATAEKFPR